MKFSDLVAFAVLLEACCTFYFIYCASLLLRSAHASWSQVLVALSGNWIDGLLLLVAAALYWRVAQARPWLRVLAIAGAVYRTFLMMSSHNFVRSYWSVFEGDIVAISVVGALGFLVIGVLAVADYFVDKSRRRRLQ